ncbi:MAG: MoxR family ATPase, partial [Pseudomonadota bacterium]
LPEAQLDRFLLQIDVGFPSEADERDMLVMTMGADDEAPSPLLAPDDLMAAQALLTQMPVSSDVMDAIVQTVRSLRPEGPDAALDWGPGPRAGQALIAASRARAFLAGRSAPLLDDVAALLPPTLRHRMALGYRARAEGQTIAAIIEAAAARL